MKKYFMLACFLVIVFPSVMTIFLFNSKDLNEDKFIDTTAQSMKDVLTICVDILHNYEIIRLPLEEYVVGVVLGEMPADFESEALKAQAVVARTYICRRMNNPKHENAMVCTESSCCQSFLSDAEYHNRGGTDEQITKISNAVMDTAGLTLMYDGQYIEATYFSCSGGRTEDAADVWGQDVPYLQSVTSPGEESAAHFTDTVKIPCDEFLEKLGVGVDKNELQIGSITYTAGGGVDTIELCGEKIKGTYVRSRLNLRSTVFTATVIGNHVIITTKGFGHRVGMSQYGADAMAVQGADYEEILAHYFPGTVLKCLAG